MIIYKIMKDGYYGGQKESDIVPMEWTDVAPSDEVLRFRWMKFVNGSWVGTETDPNLYTNGDSVIYKEALVYFRKRIFEIVESQGIAIKDFFTSKAAAGDPDPAGFKEWTDYWGILMSLESQPGFNPLDVDWPTPPSL